MVTQPATQTAQVIPFTGPSSTAVWPIPGDVSDLLTIVQDQAETIAAQAVLIDGYQTDLNNAQNPGAVSTALGTAAGTTSLTIANLIGPAIAIGATVTVAGQAFSPPLQIIAQTSGPVGSAGVYLTSQPTTMTNANLTITGPPLAATAIGNGTASGTPATTLTVSAVAGGSIVNGSVVAGAGVPTGTTIVAQQSGTVGSNGVYTTSVATTAASAALTFTPPPLASPWPVPRDAPTLLTVQQDQTAVIRTQTALIQQYIDLLNDSQVSAPPVGP
jgi:hypothetical protein